MNPIQEFTLWIESTKNDSHTQNELLKMSKNSKLIEEGFSTDLKFGTGGLRGMMGVGSNRLNSYTVRKATQGIANYIVKNSMKKSCVIAYDTRNNSYDFAQQVARVMLGNNFNVYLFDSFTPTPELSYAVRKLNCSIGIVITASHNPPIYNGYKVYGDDGGQITLDQANAILQEISEVHIFNDIQIYLGDLSASSNLKLLHDDLDQSYCEAVLGLLGGKQLDYNLKIVYSSLHGTGIKLIPRVLESMKAGDVIIVKEQAIPDGNFSTVKSPNPEESEALKLSIQLGKLEKADLVLATDPDCDRLGVAVRTSNDEYFILSGNQIGALLIDFLVQDSMHPLKRNAVIKTIVTSELGALIAKKSNCDVFDTLTGFKYIGEKIKEFESSQSHHFLFGFEESYGYLCGTFVRDKDAVIAASLITALVSHLKSKGYTLLDRLIQIQEEFGYFSEKLISIDLSKDFKVDDVQHILKTFSNKDFLSTRFSNLAYIEDYNHQTRLETLSNNYSTIDLPRENVIKISFQDKSWFALRPSGTEPKLKIYISCVDNQRSLSEHKLDDFMKRIQQEIKELLENRNV